MKSFPLFVLAAVLFASPAFAQQPETDRRVIKIVSQRSLSTLTAEDVYTPADEKFTIALPKTPDRVIALTPELMGYPGSGNQLGWFVKEGFVSVMYYDYRQENVPKTETALGIFFKGFKEGILTSMKGTFSSEKTYKIADRSAYEFKFEMADGHRGYARSFFVDERNYALLAITSPGNANAEPLILKTFDSLVSKANDKK
jgi:hypothetical protein